MKFRLTCLAFSFLSIGLSAQTLDEAKALYLDGKFAQAKPIFQKELADKPEDPSLNHWYGVCLYETGGSLLESENHLKIAASKNIQDAFLYLGDIYAKTYRFHDANTEYAKYEKLKRRDKAALAKLETHKENAERFKRFALRTEDIQIIDSLVVDKKQLLSAYKLSPSLGELEYRSGKPETTAFVNGTETKIYYGAEDKGQINLFSEEKLIDGFANPRVMSNSRFGLTGNVNYPSVLSDGVTIYFAAEDLENGVGGYDLYITRYNMNNDTYLTPERLNAPFNSSFNDYLLVIDEEKGVGWFASDRFQAEGKVCVYTFIPNQKVQMIEGDDEDAIVKRAYISSIADTWKPKTDYSKLRALAKKEGEKAGELKRDFIFVINDGLVYYELSNFKNENALESFLKARELKENFNSLERQLSELREKYYQGSQSDRHKLSYAILDIEAQLPNLQEKIRDFELKAKSQENQYLGN